MLFWRKPSSILGHIINGASVSVDANKFKTVLEWPEPITLKALCGFLKLVGHYRKFIQNYGQIAAPLTCLLKEHSCTWNEDANNAFAKLKKVLSAAPVLQLPNFDEEFIVELDASIVGIGTVLQQHDYPIAFVSRKLAYWQSKLPAYEQELIGLAKAVQHWCPYLWGHEFVIHTDHFSFKYLFKQRLITSPQQ